MIRFLRMTAVVACAGLLAACAQTFETYYATPVSPAVSQNWRLHAVTVSVPDSLTVSEADTLIPDADIVWHGDLPGDRRAQVAAIVQRGVIHGASGLHGRTPVDMLVTVEKFHALTPRAAKLEMDDVGVHDIHFQIEVVDARTHAVLAPAQEIDATLPALTGENAAVAAAQGNTQKVLITRHIAATIAGWLSIGPDNRDSFTRIGG